MTMKEFTCVIIYLASVAVFSVAVLGWWGGR